MIWDYIIGSQNDYQDSGLKKWVYNVSIPQHVTLGRGRE